VIVALPTASFGHVDTVGEGTPVILIGGAFNDRSTVAALAAALAPGFTAVTYDRRARGGSGDQRQDYTTQSELDDLAAVIDHVGGRAGMFGHSSGAVLALQGVLHKLPIDKVAVYESPYVVNGNRPAPPADLLEHLVELLDAEDHDSAAALFLHESVGLHAEMVDMMRAGEGWNFMTGQAKSLPYDVAVHRAGMQLPPTELAGISIPTLAIYGDQTWPWLAAATQAVAAAVPGAELTVLQGEDHSVLQRPHALTPTLTEFFGQD
jgi:pimeloyl-ACP methyl ester carboxylesterase